MKSPPQLSRIAACAHHSLISHHCASTFSPTCLLVQVKHSILYFVPFHALLLGLFPSPTRPSKARKPPVHHQQSQLRGSTGRLTLRHHLLEPLLGLTLGLASHSLN